MNFEQKLTERSYPDAILARILNFEYFIVFDFVFSLHEEMKTKYKALLTFESCRGK